MAAISWKAGTSTNNRDLAGIRALATSFSVLRMRGELGLARAVATVCASLLKTLGRTSDADQYIRYVSQTPADDQRNKKLKG